MRSAPASTLPYSSTFPALCGSKATDFKPTLATPLVVQQSPLAYAHVGLLLAPL